MSNATNFYTYLALLAAVRRSLLSGLATLREIRLGEFSDNRNNLCNNNYNFIFGNDLGVDPEKIFNAHFAKKTYCTNSIYNNSCNSH